MNEELFIRVVSSIVTIAILLVAVTVGALLGDDPDEMFAWGMVCTVTLSMGAIIAVYRFEDELDSI
ncbi:hypothetical protein [Halorubrum tebenquichense]|uniref:Uncharacterized protein n=1 Tax=Halorubrum tebenquichense DSM 14210 TaxID=1227485 RepID=M0DK09_9EURY|nr:hypothetical protein [Halorubrum tebenquichense]ELZ35815.1 hypothetical protein C472_11239 [Halorubrum tebenquichense DSM 14210]